MNDDDASKPLLGKDKLLLKKHPLMQTPSERRITASMLDSEEAETDNLRSIERKQPLSFVNARTSGVSFHDDDDNISSNENDDDSSIDSDANGDDAKKRATEKPRRPAPSFKDIGKRIMLATQMQDLSARRHRSTNSTMAHNVLSMISGGTDVSDTTFQIEDNEDMQRAEALIHDNGAGSDNDSIGSREQGSVSTYGTLPTRIVGTRLSSPTRRAWRRFQRACARKLKPSNLFPFLSNALSTSLFVWVAIPCFFSALFLFYVVANPELDFLPGQAKLSWWLNFTGRQVLMFEFARICEFIIVDTILASRMAIHFFGSFVTFIGLQSQGWPFILAAWGGLDLLLLHGNNKFQTHWFFWTGLRIYNQGNSGSYILSSSVYLRVLLSAIIAGVATSCKRAALAIRFGRRQLADFKPRLEKILKDVVIISEIAAVAREVENMGEESGLLLNLEEVMKGREKGRWNVDFSKEDGSVDHELDDTQRTTDECSATSPPLPKRSPSKTSSDHIKLKDMLDRWEEPINKSDKSSYVQLSEVLAFRRALHMMNETFPFGEAFGPAGEREQCIDSAHVIYSRLLKLHPDKHNLQFDSLTFCGVNEEGHIDNAKMSAIRRLFRPDVQKELTLLTFIQCVDNVYKRLRFFRASVGNSSVIDEVLESIINGIFYFVLGLMLLSFMQFNPWPLLVSMTSLLVSVSFALGSSVSKYVEGLLLITVRRPFDLGDRIFFTGTETIDVPGPIASWFVEDISLFSTTLRFAKTNEVSSVNNASIAASRIINCNRSPGAVVLVTFKTHLCVLDDDKLDQLRADLQKEVDRNPRTWETMLFLRKDDIDSDNEQVFFSLAFRHRNSWQDAGRILLNRGELLQHIYKTLKKLKIAFDSPPARRLIYEGGSLQVGGVDASGSDTDAAVEYKRNLLRPRNIRRSSSVDSSDHHREHGHALTPFLGDIIDNQDQPQIPVDGI